MVQWFAFYNEDSYSANEYQAMFRTDSVEVLGADSDSMLYNFVDFALDVRPTFVVDLSQVNYSVVK